MKTNKVTLYVGLNDKDTKIQVIETRDAYVIAQGLTASITGGGTIYEAMGVYTHENGEIVQERTLRIEIFNSAIDRIRELVARLKTALNQESIIMQEEVIESVFL